MPTVDIWICQCGTKYRAVTETDSKSKQSIQSGVECVVCQRMVNLDGKLTGLSFEVKGGTWIDIPVSI